MAGDPAIVKIVNALADVLAGVPQVQVFTDRNESEPLSESEVPAIVVNMIDTSLDERQEHGFHAQIHTATIHLDFYENFEAFNSISFRQQEMIAQAAAFINADWSLGGRLQELTFIGVSNASNAQADEGAAVLELRIRFVTHFNDWTVLIGTGGEF